MKSLFIMAKSVNKVYGGPCNGDGAEWKCRVTHNDIHNSAIFLLESCSSGGEAYRQAHILALNIPVIQKIHRMEKGKS